MSTIAAKVAVVGSGVSGAICASSLARIGVSVTLFDSARGPGGRMSHRRETTDDGKELFFDHGAPYFTASQPDILRLVQEWVSKGIVAQWDEVHGTFDSASKKFLDVDKFDTTKDVSSKKYVGVSGMNSICKALCGEPGLETKFGVGVGKIDWLVNENLWSLIGFDGQYLGKFDCVVASDKNIASRRISDVSGRDTPLDPSLFPEWAEKIKDIPVRSCFALMLAFAEPLSSIPFKCFSIKNSEILSAAFCNSSKPGRSDKSECWVLHSTAEYAYNIISQHGLAKPSNALLTKVAKELLLEFQSIGLCGLQPYFTKAHRWGSAFPAASIAREEKCVWDEGKGLAICGDFCVSPNVEGAICSGVVAAANVMEKLRSFRSL
ncbi:hypothetical protein Droror1_Dr00004575 [Drosera rotundifolia]